MVDTAAVLVVPPMTTGGRAVVVVGATVVGGAVGTGAKEDLVASPALVEVVVVAGAERRAEPEQATRATPNVPSAR